MDEENKCLTCESYDPEDDRCSAFECWGLGFMDGCPPLPCEQSED